MRLFVPVAMCLLLAGGAMAQRGGGGGGGGRGMGGGGMGGSRGGMGGGSGGYGGGFGGSRGGSFGGFNGGNRGGFGGFNGGFNRGGFVTGFRPSYGYGRGFYGGYYPYFGYGFGWDSGYLPGYYEYPWNYGGYASSAYAAYPVYNPSSNVTVVYPEPGPRMPVERATPVTHDYDEYGQEIHGGSDWGGGNPPPGSPIYLIAFQDHVIRAAAAYWVDAKTLHYVTLEHEEKRVPLDTVDRQLSMQLNHERHVQFQLPQ